VLGKEDKVIPGLYVTGWLKRGATGILGTNINDAKETVDSVLMDAAKVVLKETGTSTDPAKAVMELLRVRSNNIGDKGDKEIVNWAGYKRIALEERKRGAAFTPPKGVDKLVSVREMMESSCRE
jgi:NADPH-dependent glutamate synthase beta subunit-like oxidoreductase